MLGLAVALFMPTPAHAVIGETAPWWVWPIALFVVTFFLGIVATLAGVGGGVLFVPIVGSLFPFHLDFVRGAGILLALAAAMSATAGLLRSGLASLRLAMPLALAGSITSIAGALIGLALPVDIVEITLGIAILAIALLMLRPPAASAQGVAMDGLAKSLGLSGSYLDAATGTTVHWHTGRTATGLALFAVIGFLAGFFGIGAGWANVPVLSIVMGAPLKVAVATSSATISMINTSAAWVYLRGGAVLPLLTIPSILGVMLGARIGGRLVRVAPARTIRIVVVSLLVVAGLRVLLHGTGILR